MENKYQNGKIYKIINPEMPGLVYYGSTVQTLKCRMSRHKSPSNKSCSKALFEYGIPEIILIEDYPCATRKELCLREGEYQLGNECINKYVAGRTDKEYRENNKDKINEKGKIYKEKNKDKLSEKKKIYYENNKDKIKEKSKIYYDNNHDKINEKNKIYRDNNKDKLNEKFECDCGGRYINALKSQHIKTKKHQSFISSKITYICEI